MIIFPSIFNTLHIFWQGPVGLWGNCKIYWGRWTI